MTVGKAISDRIDQYTSVTYTRTSATGQVYSGRTSGYGRPAALVAAREARHPERLAGFGPAVVDQVAYGAKGYAAIVGREQQLIDANGGAQSGGGTSANLIRAVGKNNPLGQALHALSNTYFGPLASYTGN
jgi:hypothetical protein